MSPRTTQRRFSRALVAGLLLLGLACGEGRDRDAAPEGPTVDPRPSFLLIVLDTVRRDAVSAYGVVDGSTPNLDRLAREGLRFEFAFAPTPWTVPSHATLFTGLPQHAHGVGLRGSLHLPDEIVTLAERMRDAGYQTAGFSENQLVGAEFNLIQGFEDYAYEAPRENVARQKRGQKAPAFDIVERVARWAATRNDERPFFVFVNLLDAHDPYVIRDANPFLPDGVDAIRARSAQPVTGGAGGIAERIGICDRIPPRDDLEILKGLYLGEVAAADAKLGKIRELLLNASAAGELVTIATADHGEHLGERRMLGHEFSVRNELLNVPLIVHGLTDTQPGVLEQRVQLADLAPSILTWARLDIPPVLPGRPLPLAPTEDAPERSIVGAYIDEVLVSDEGVLPDGLTIRLGGNMKRRKGCSSEDRVFGDQMALVRYPHKLIWYENHAPELYDLSWDPTERSDQSSFNPDITTQLEQELAEIRQQFEAERTTTSPAPPPEALEALRNMGYLE